MRSHSAADLDQAAEREATEAARVLDLPERRLRDRLAQGIDHVARGGLEFGAYRADHSGLGAVGLHDALGRAVLHDPRLAVREVPLRIGVGCGAGGVRGLRRGALRLPAGGFRLPLPLGQFGLRLGRGFGRFRPRLRLQGGPGLADLGEPGQAPGELGQEFVPRGSSLKKNGVGMG